MSSKRVALSKIPSLTFYKDAQTLSRRGQPVDQLVCIGKPCELYQPEVVRCVNIGGEGTDVDWKCEADLPEALRFGKVEVSCEGWSGPGDSSVLKGSCSLEYRLTQIPGSLRSNEPYFPSRVSRWFQDPASLAFMFLWGAMLLMILYSILKSCFARGSSGRTTGSGPRAPGSGGPPSVGWYSGSRPDDPSGRPPPYSKSAQSPATAQDGWRPGFWTGAALGGLGTYLFNRRERVRETGARPAMYDWERERTFLPVRGMRRAPSSSHDDRGEGPSNLGAMRRSTGYGGSNVR
ncbi:hypothetical protein B0H21DRAFT_756691 [Amylocystis lapponica]|nr:hypothetical protein B0H21DRAFT_756691 [Amylocystis lapponica]